MWSGSRRENTHGSPVYGFYETKETTQATESKHRLSSGDDAFRSSGRGFQRATAFKGSQVFVPGFTGRWKIETQLSFILAWILAAFRILAPGDQLLNGFIRPGSGPEHLLDVLALVHVEILKIDHVEGEQVPEFLVPIAPFI